MKVLAERRRNLTGEYSGRFAAAVCRANVDEWQLAKRNLVAHRKSPRRRIGVIEKRLRVGVGNKKRKVRGYRTRSEAAAKRNRVNHLRQKLEAVDAALQENRVKVCRGGAGLARKRHNLDAAGLTVEQWKQQWRVSRGWFAAVGNTGERFGNDTINVNPTTGVVEIMLPPWLAGLSNTPGRRRTIQLEAPAGFEHLGDEWSQRAEAGRCLRYEIAFKHNRRNAGGGWYLKASWAINAEPSPSLTELRQHRTLAVDFNGDHFAGCVIASDGNPVGGPVTVPLDTKTRSTTATDAYVRERILDLGDIADEHDCATVTVEDLGFDEARDEGRDRSGTTKQFRNTVSAMPTSIVKRRLVSMLINRDRPIYVIAVDPAYTSVTGETHWLEILRKSYNTNSTGHHAAAVVIGRRGQGYVARRRFGIHAAEQKSRRCFVRSINTRGAAETPTNLGGGTNQPTRQTATEPTNTAEDARHTADTPETVAQVQGEDKQVTAPQRLKHGPNTHV